ncbi:UNVERIFIED_ORG: hypothetical protein ABIC97_003017 [Peribacillus simplex]
MSILAILMLFLSEIRSLTQLNLFYKPIAYSFYYRGSQQHHTFKFEKTIFDEFLLYIYIYI